MIAVTVGQTNIFLFRKVNTWFSVKDGAWSDPNTWVSNALDKKNTLWPQAGDNIWINNNVSLDINATINNLYGNGYLSIAASISLTVNGDIQITGTVDQTASNTNLILNGYNNTIVNYSASTSSYMIYNSTAYTQSVMSLAYGSLTTQGTGLKLQTSNLIIAGTFNQQSNYDCGVYNLTVNGASTLGFHALCTFYKSGAGNLLFVGSVDFEGNIDLSGGNPNIEFRGGVNISTFLLKTGTGNISFTTNNQTITSSAYLSGNWSGPTTIQGGITVTLTGGSSFQLNNTLNGTVAGSTFNNSGTLYLNINMLPMTTGVFNYMYTSASTIGYMFTGNSTLPFTTYANLIIDGTGIKSQSGNTIINKTLIVNGSVTACVYECNGYNLTVMGQFTNQGSFKANAFCNILFIGLAYFANGADSTTGVDLRIGNPNIEFRGGLTTHCNFTYTGAGTFTFTTNNQNIDFGINNGGLWAANMLISGAISVAFLEGTVGVGSNQGMSGTLNGDNANSIFINKGAMTYLNAQQPMQTGKLYCNQVANTFIYGASGNQDITMPSDATPGYQNLILNGSGAKRLLGNVSVKGTYTLTSPATLNSNGFSLTNP